LINYLQKNNIFCNNFNGIYLFQGAKTKINLDLEILFAYANYKNISINYDILNTILSKKLNFIYIYIYIYMKFNIFYKEIEKSFNKIGGSNQKNIEELDNHTVLQEENNKLKSELDKLKDNHTILQEEYRKKLEENEKENLEWEEIYTGLQKSNKNLIDRINKNNKELINEFKEENNKLKSELDKLKDDHTILQEEYRKKLEENEKNNTEWEETYTAMEKLNSDSMKKINNYNIKLMNEIQKLKQEINKLKNN